MTTQTTKPAFLTPNELAARWGVHPVSVYKWHKAGLIPQPFRVGTNLRWHLSDIEAHENAPKRATRVAEATTE